MPDRVLRKHDRRADPLATRKTSAGTSQFWKQCGLLLTSVNTSPGAMNTFIRREVSDVGAGTPGGLNWGETSVFMGLLWRKL